MTIYYKDDCPLPTVDRQEDRIRVSHDGHGFAVYTDHDPGVVMLSHGFAEPKDVPMLRLCLAYAEMILDALREGRGQ